MKNITLLFVSIILGCTPLMPAEAQKKFVMKHHIQWNNIPGNLPFSYTPSINISPTEPYEFYAKGADVFNDFPDEMATRELVHSKILSQKEYYFNIEHLPNKFQDSVKDQMEAIHRLTSILLWTKHQNPLLEIGFYSIEIQKPSFWLNSNPDALAKYKARNDLFRSISSFTDIIYVDLYTMDNSLEHWKNNLDIAVAESKKYDKTVLMFIWPQYHNSAPNALELIPGDFWRYQLEQIYNSSDGFIIWTGKNMEWSDMTSETDPNNWWYQTLDFMKSKGL